MTDERSTSSDTTRVRDEPVHATSRTLVGSDVRAVGSTPAGTVDAVLGLIMGTCFLFPYVVSYLVSVRAVGFVVALAIIVRCVRRPDTTLITSLAVGIWLVWGAVVTLGGGIVGRNAGDPLYSVNSQRILVVVPTFVVLGLVLARSPRLPHFVRGLVVPALLAAVLAIAERLVGFSLFARTQYFRQLQRDGGIRALGAADHPLVLGAILVILIPLTSHLGRHLRWPASILLVLGAMSTGSRGPAAVGVVLLVVHLDLTERVIAKFRPVLRHCAILLLGTLAVLSAFVWEPYASGATGASYSTNYRSALYALAPKMLVARPLGYGFSDIPRGVWLIGSELRGTQDAAVTIDSEIVYAMLSLGIVGLLLYYAALNVTLRALHVDRSLAAAGATATLFGVVLALHAWDTLGPLWYLLVGASWQLVRSRRSSASTNIRDIAAILLSSLHLERERLEHRVFHWGSTVASWSLVPTSLRLVIYRTIGIRVGSASIAPGVLIRNRHTRIHSGVQIHTGVVIDGEAQVLILPGAVVGQGVTIGTELSGSDGLISAPVVIDAGRYVPPGTKVQGGLWN